MVIKQGDIYWIDLGEPIGSEPAYLRPYVVIQNDLLNSSQIRTVIVCALTSNLRRGKAMGNVLLELGEANLDRQSVVNVSQIFTVDKALLIEKIGTLSKERIRQIFAGLIIVIEPQEINLDDDNQF
jgi:mRNA interferase MazF